METAQKTLLESAIQLRDLLEQEQGQGQEPAEDDDDTLMMVLDTFIQDQEFSLGLIKNTYDSDLQRRTILRHNLMHNTDLVLDAINEHSNGDPLPPAAMGLCRILFEITFASFLTIKRIEAAHPGLAVTFEAERATYNATRET